MRNLTIHSMAKSAMVFILSAALLLSGCGTEIYESLIEGETGSAEEADNAESDSEAAGKAGGSVRETGQTAGAYAESAGEAKADRPAPASEDSSAGDGSGGEIGSDAQHAAEEDTDTEEDPPATIRVYICGAVRESAVYELPEGARVYEALAMAGGLLPEADPTAVNQAAELYDGEMLIIYSREEAEALRKEGRLAVPAGEGAAGAAAASASADVSGGTAGKKVNINTADASELMTLPGIGESRAADIIAFREQNGAFGSPEEIMKVSGIKTALYAKIEQYITV